MHPKSHETAFKLFKQLQLDEGYKIEKKVSWFRILLANLFHYWEDSAKNRRPVAVSRNDSDWKQNQYNLISRKIIKYMDALKKNNYIDMKKGYKGKKDSRITRIWPTKKLLNYFPKNPRTVWKPTQLVELRELDSSKRIDYDDTEKTKRIRSALETINQVNNNAEIWHPEEGEISVHLISIFKGSFELYGRLHTSGPDNVQGLPAEERRKLVINGHSVIELDFSALHPHLLYASEEIQYFGDPYLAGGQNPVLRPMFKIMLMAMLHADDKEEVFKAVNHWLYKNPKEKRKLRNVGILPRYKQNRKKPSVKKYIMPLIDDFAEAHQPIAHHFLTGKKSGLHIMNKDASVALAILKALTDKGVPCISIHDSFAVPAPYEGYLRELMQEKYYEITGGYRCPVTREYEPLESPKLIGLETRFELAN